MTASYIEMKSEGIRLLCYEMLKRNRFNNDYL